GSTGGPFMVQGNHSYADEGTYTVKVTLTDDNTPNSFTITRASALTVNDVTPAVAADNAAVSAAENASASNSGTFADFDDAVTISADVGRVPQSGSQSGTWSWSGTGDEDAPYTVTITATNADGSTATATFDVSFTDVAPAVAADTLPDALPIYASASNSGTFADFDDAVTISA